MHKNVCFFIVAVLLWIPDAIALDLSATEYARREFDRDIGDDSVSQVEMTLIDKSGRTRQRELEVAMRFADELRQQRIRFHTPKNIEGTTFLSWEKQDGDDDQFLYLPAAGRVRRIVGGQKEKSFVNTTYSFEDLERRHYKKDEFKKMANDTVIGRSCTWIRRTPKDSGSSQYGAVEACVDDQLFLTLHARYLDTDGEKVKELFVYEIGQVQGFWTVLKSELKDLEDGSSTVLTVRSIRYNVGLDDQTFSKSRIKAEG